MLRQVYVLVSCKEFMHFWSHLENCLVPYYGRILEEVTSFELFARKFYSVLVQFFLYLRFSLLYILPQLGQIYLNIGNNGDNIGHALYIPLLTHFLQNPHKNQHIHAGIMHRIHSLALTRPHDNPQHPQTKSFFLPLIPSPCIPIPFPLLKFILIQLIIPPQGPCHKIMLTYQRKKMMGFLLRCYKLVLMLVFVQLGLEY